MKNFKAGYLIEQGGYKSFQPEPLCRKWVIEDMDVLALLSKADRFMGRLDMYSEFIDVDLFIQMYVAKEATLSSKIEGTQTTMQDAFLDRSDIDEERRDDWEEIQNYIKAMNETISLLDTLPFSTRLLREAHTILLQGVRGQHREPGEFRRSQNWIGGVTLADAAFIPPVYTMVGELMSDIEFFANKPEYNLPDLIKIALIHYQFETIHPFLDGNGRTGRLMITLYLVSKGILKRPLLYLSAFLERHRRLYYDNLMKVRFQNDIAQWLKFFLTGVIETSQKGVETLQNIMHLKEDVDKKCDALGKRGADARLVLDYLYKQPVISVTGVIALINKAPQTAYTLIADMERLGILKEITGAHRNKLYSFDSYLDLFQTL